MRQESFQHNTYCFGDIRLYYVMTSRHDKICDRVHRNEEGICTEYTDVVSSRKCSMIEINGTMTTKVRFYCSLLHNECLC